MPGIKNTYRCGGKKRLRRTSYRYIGVRENDHYNIHRLSQKLGMSIVDTIALIVAKNLEAFAVDPLTAEDLLRMEESALIPSAQV